MGVPPCKETPTWSPCPRSTNWALEAQNLATQNDSWPSERSEFQWTEPWKKKAVHFPLNPGCLRTGSLSYEFVKQSPYNWAVNQMSHLPCDFEDPVVLNSSPFRIEKYIIWFASNRSSNITQSSHEIEEGHFCKLWKHNSKHIMSKSSRWAMKKIHQTKLRSIPSHSTGCFFFNRVYHKP